MGDRPSELTASDREMRRKMRRLYEEDPEAFSRAVADLQRAGQKWPKQLPPIETGRVGRQTLALLLAEYRIRELLHGRKMKRLEWLEEQARLGVRYGSAYSVGTWRTVDAIKSQLTRAERLARSDPSFAAKVSAAAHDLLEIGGSRARVK